MGETKTIVYCKDRFNHEALRDCLAMCFSDTDIKVDIFVRTQEKEYFYTKESEEHLPFSNPVILVFHVNESNKECARLFIRFITGTTSEYWTEYSSKEEADKYVDSLFRNNIPYNKLPCSKLTRNYLIKE